MTKTYLIVLLLFFSRSILNAQNLELYSIKKRALKSAKKMGDALVHKDYKTVVHYIIPDILNCMGGEDKVLQTLRREFSKRNEIIAIDIHTPSDTLMSNDEIQCTLIEDIKIKVKDGVLLTRCTLIGISNDKGKNWHFIEANRSIDELMKIYPNFSDRLLIEPMDKPILIRD